jgi:uncharacterized protein YndB with AHSA1/START domain
MKKPLWAGLKLPLKTSKEIVWSVLTEPKYTRQYMYNCALKCNWSAGNEAQWVEQHPNGSETVHVRGELLEFAPYSRLLFTIFHQGNNVLNGQSSKLCFVISSHNEGVILTIKQGDFSSFPQAEEIHAECLRGWVFVKKDLIATCYKIT